MKHTLKIWPQYFDAVASGAKPFEARTIEDRTFAVGDVLLLEEWDPAGEFPNRYTGRTMERTVTYVLADGLEWKGKPCAILGLALSSLAPAGEVDVKRWEKVSRGGYNEGDTMEECPGFGDYVLFTDYAALQAKLAEAEGLRDSLTTACELESARADKAEARVAELEARVEELENCF